MPTASVREETTGEVKRRWPPWLALSLGFGGLLACVIGAAAGTLVELNHVRNDETQSRQAFLERLGALDQIRGQIYLSGTYVRDFLLSPDPDSARAETTRLAGLEMETHEALHRYSRVLEAEERVPFVALQSEIEAYWRVLDRTLAWSPEERNRFRSSFFYDELVPRRTTMLQIADRISAVNEHGLNRAEERLAASSEGLRRSLILTFVITLVGCLVLALLTVIHTLRLDRELERRLEENARARADLRELSARLLRAQENERRSLARELHDEVGQSLSAILMEAENAVCAEDPRETADHLQSIRTLAERTVNEVRDLALLLRPSMLDDFGLIPALNWHARETAKRTGLRIAVSAGDDADDLPDEHKTCIYRLVQEAVNNAAHHGNARSVEVTLQRESRRVLATVRDDGAGFDTRFVRGMGLLGMEERVRRLGGRFQIDSQLGCGTVVSAELPVVELAEPSGRDAHSHIVG
ncbi:MAG: MCP four helix bundle domain-containing protein [Acidobacteriota bacterium]|nr:MCP four helix bundle domain-containing protein [Acidobacteriota bacterium]